MEDKTYRLIPQDALVDMQLSAVFMMRVQSLLNYIARNYGQDKFIEFAKHAIEEQGEPRNELEEHIVTLISLLNEFESKALEQNKTVDLTREQIKEQTNGN